MIKAIRVFYRKSDSLIVWQHGLSGTGEFPTTIENSLEELAIKFGGVPSDYACIEITDSQTISGFSASDTNTIVNGILVIGTPRPPSIPSADDLPQSNVAVILKSVSADGKLAVVTRTYLGIAYDIACSIAYSIIKEFSVSPKKINIGDTVILCYLEHSEYVMPAIIDKIM